MHEESIVQIEQQLGRQLPAAYREVLRHYPPPLREPGEFGPFYYELYGDAQRLVDANSGKSELWKDRPAEYLVIGDNGCGNVYAIDTADPSAPVYGVSCHHGEFVDNTAAGEPCRIADSINDYTDRLIRESGFRSPPS